MYANFIWTFTPVTFSRVTLFHYQSTDWIKLHLQLFYISIFQFNFFFQNFHLSFNSNFYQSFCLCMLHVPYTTAHKSNHVICFTSRARLIYLFSKFLFFELNFCLLFLFFSKTIIVFKQQIRQYFCDTISSSSQNDSLKQQNINQPKLQTE